MGNCIGKALKFKRAKIPPSPLPEPDPPDPPRQEEVITEKKLLVKALYDFEARTQEEISFRKGDKLEVLDDENSDWWYARHLSTQQDGYIPSNFVQNYDKEDWNFGHISRKDAERLLKVPGNNAGTFLVRESESAPGTFALSVLDVDSNGIRSVKHYRIRNLDEGRGYYITTRKTFGTLRELVENYSEHMDGLNHLLISACPRAPPQVDMPQGWELQRDELIFLRKLGEGHFAQVWFGTWKGVLDVAIKTLKPGSSSPSAFLQEAKIMTKTRHDKLVQLYGVCSEQEPIYIVTEYMKNGNLLQYLRHGAGKEADLSQLIDIAAQVASGMAFLEAENLIHRDLAARNILVGANNAVKVADFGLARIIEEGSIYTPAVSTTKTDLRIPIKWTAPEAAFQQTFTIKSDVWSYGIMLHELFTKGQVPYPGMTNREVLEAVEKGYRMPKASETPSEAYEVQMMCWVVDPERRPTFEYLFVFFDDFAVNIEQSYESGDVVG